MLLSFIFGGMALLSLCLTIWQWVVARRFPLHQRVGARVGSPAVTLLKPLKGCDEATEACLESWLTQVYDGRVQVIFGVASDRDPVCEVVRRLLKKHAGANAELVVCGPLTGTNLKVSKLIQLERMAEHEILIISDADVRVPPDFLVNVTAPLEREQAGLVNCFYRLANPGNVAMAWESVAINSDFWSQVLQAESLKPLDFALGAVMATRRSCLREIGGFEGLKDCLADDYQLGKRLAGRGHEIVLCPVVVECWSEPMEWGAVWKHQLRWGRTIRVCQPVAYFFSVLSNATLWPVAWVCVQATERVVWMGSVCLLVRIVTALDQQRMLTGAAVRLRNAPMVVVKDVLQFGIWLCAFLGNRIEWRGERMRLMRDGTLVRG